MQINKICEIETGQDGAVLGDFLFRFDHKGNCFVYDLKNIKSNQKASPFSSFSLDMCEKITPHSNSVTFSGRYYKDGDEFPLIYTNIYNNYAKEDDRLEGLCCVYRIVRNGSEFKSTLLQLIKIDFVDDSALWCSKNKDDIRPYGNFVADKNSGKLYAFTMRDYFEKTRYFSFNLPKISDGILDEKFGVKKITLKKEDIIDFFDCDYHRFVQGAAIDDGKIYSLEGFTDDEKNIPALRIVDTDKKAQLSYIQFTDYGLFIEPELIDFFNGICYYCDHSGNLYTITF